MPVFFAAMPEIWKILLVVFVVIPVVRWTIWPARPARLSRRHAAVLADLDFDFNGDGRRIRRRDFDELKAELDGRLTELEQLHARVEELENRLDFTERLLAQRSDPALPSHSTR